MQKELEKRGPKLLRRLEIETKQPIVDPRTICPVGKTPVCMEVYPAKVSKSGRLIGKKSKVIVWIEEE